MGRFTLALGYILTGDRRYLAMYHNSFDQTPIQRVDIKTQRFLRQLNAGKPANLQVSPSKPSNRREV